MSTEMKLVPSSEMTPDMMEAGQRYLDERSLRRNFDLPAPFNWHEFWQAMLAAAPVAPAPVAVKALEWRDEVKHGLRMRVATCLGLVYELAVKCWSPGWIATLGGLETIYDGDDEDEAIAACNAHATASVRACLVDAPVAAGWQAMETAPKDGRVILGYWSPESIETIAFRYGAWVWSSDGDSWHGGSAPTYWMPLPAAPGEG